MAQQTTTPQQKWTINRVLLLIGAVCFFIAALNAPGVNANIADTSMWPWAWGAFSAWVLASVIP